MLGIIKVEAAYEENQVNIRKEVLDAADAVMNADWPAEIVQVLDDFYWAAFNKGFDAGVELSDPVDAGYTPVEPSL